MDNRIVHYDAYDCCGTTRDGHCVSSAASHSRHLRATKAKIVYSNRNSPIRNWHNLLKTKDGGLF